MEMLSAASPTSQLTAGTPYLQKLIGESAPELPKEFIFLKILYLIEGKRNREWGKGSERAQ